MSDLATGAAIRDLAEGSTTLGVLQLQLATAGQ